MINNKQLNVFGEKLEACCFDPKTGWQRDGYCNLFPDDLGQHLVCVTATEGFLDYSKATGNDLSTPTDFFPGLKPGDKWCVCLLRVVAAFNAGQAPIINLAATHISVLEVIPLNILEQMAIANA